MRLVYFILTIVCNTLFRFYPFCFQFGRPEENHTTFAVGQALGYIFLLLSVDPSTLSGKYQNLSSSIYTILFWCLISNLMDELFFNPLVFGWNEKVFIVFIIIHTCYWNKIKKWFGYSLKPTVLKWITFLIKMK